MKTLNLYTLTRARNHKDFSRLLRLLSGRPDNKAVGEHEADSLRTFTGQLCDSLESSLLASGSEEAGAALLRYLDGFWFSYTIAHISKEFDLLKLSENGEYILNVELKSENIGEERIRKQLEQNRYYLSNVSRNIYSFTYVMETHALYQLNDRRYLKQCSFSDLAQVLTRPSFSTYITENLDHFFRAADYLISPVSTPDRLLQDKYFLTNQQWEFRRSILEQIQSFTDAPPVITVTGEAGTGKTLLLFDLALALSKKKKVLFLHGGPLREGHHLIHSRLKNVDILSSDQFPADSLSSTDYTYLLVDEANRLPSAQLSALIRSAVTAGMPCVLAYDLHSLLGTLSPLRETEKVMESFRTVSLEFSGNIRINRPVFSFLRALFHQKERSENADYSCIDVLYAADAGEEALLTEYYCALGYKKLPVLSGSSDVAKEGTESDVIAEEYEKVLVVLDGSYHYDDSLYLRADDEKSLLSLYEVISRTREKLCILVTQNETLFSQVLTLRMKE